MNWKVAFPWTSSYREISKCTLESKRDENISIWRIIRTIIRKVEPSYSSVRRWGENRKSQDVVHRVLKVVNCKSDLKWKIEQDQLPKISKTIFAEHRSSKAPHHKIFAIFHAKCWACFKADCQVVEKCGALTNKISSLCLIVTKRAKKWPQMFYTWFLVRAPLHYVDFLTNKGVDPWIWNGCRMSTKVHLTHSQLWLGI